MLDPRSSIIPALAVAVAGALAWLMGTDPGLRVLVTLWATAGS